MNRKTLMLLGAGVGAAFQTISTATVALTSQEGMEWVIPIGLIFGIMGGAVTAFLAVFKTEGNIP